MRCAVDFDDQPQLEAKEVGDVVQDWPLAVESIACLLVLELFPEFCLRNLALVSEVSAELFQSWVVGQKIGAEQHSVGIDAILE